MVPRKLIITWIVGTIVLFLGILASFQYANYIDRKSNQRWCGIVTAFTDSYKENPPPPTPLGKKIATEMFNLDKDWCK